MNDRRLEIVLAARDATLGTFTKVGARVTALTTKVFSMQSAMVAAAGAAGLGLIIKKSLDAADNIGKTADAAGLSTAALQEYRHAAELSGVATQTLDKALLGFTKRAGEAKAGSGSLAEYLKKVNQALLEQIAAAPSTEAALELVFKALAETSDAGERAALSAAAFGRSGVAMTVMTKNGAAGLEAMRQEARDLGLVLDDKLVRSSESANDAIAKVTGSIKTGFLTVVTSAAPKITEVAEATSDWIKNNRELIDSGLDDFIDRAGTSATSFYTAVKPIITTGFDAVKNVWGWFDGLPAAAKTIGIIGYMLAGPLGVAPIIALGAVIKEITGDVKLAQKGLIDVDGSLDIYSEAWYAAEAATKAAKKELEEYGDILVEGTDRLDQQTKALDEQTPAVEKNAKAVTEVTESWKDYVGYASIAQAVQDDFADSLTYLDGNLKKVDQSLEEVAETSVETVTEMATGWDSFSQALEGSLAGAFQHEFDSIGGFFDDLLDNMYSMFTNWVSQIAAQQIVFSLSGGSSGANTLTSILGGGTSTAGGGDLGSIMDLAGIFQKAGAWLGEALFGWGDEPKDSKFAIQAGFERDDEGRLTPTGIGPNPMTGWDMWGQYIYGEGEKHVVNEPFDQVDEYIGTLMEAFSGSVNLFSDSLMDPLQSAFDLAVDDLVAGFDFEGVGKAAHEDIGEYLEAQIGLLETELGDLLAPTVSAFSDLQTAILSVTPAFTELVGTLSAATDAYFDPLLSIDQKLSAAGGTDFYGADLQAQTDTYKTLFDNLVANGGSFDMIVDIGTKYADSLIALSALNDDFIGASRDPAAIEPVTGARSDIVVGGINQQYADLGQMDLAATLASIRDAMLEAGGSPEDFQAGVLASLTTFKAGIDAGIASLVAAIKDLHPEIDLDIDVGVTVVGDQASATAAILQRQSAA